MQKTQEDLLLDKIRSIINNYHLSLDRQENANPAVDQFRALSAIEEVIGMPRKNGEALENYNALHMEIELGDETDRGIVIDFTTKGRIITDQFPGGTFRRDGVRFLSRPAAPDDDHRPS